MRKMQLMKPNWWAEMDREWRFNRRLKLFHTKLVDYQIILYGHSVRTTFMIVKARSPVHRFGAQAQRSVHRLQQCEHKQQQSGH